MTLKLQAKEIKPRLDSLITEAETVNRDLATRLKVIRSWIKKTKPGGLTKKRELMFFLRELIEDVDQWLAVAELDQSDRASTDREEKPDPLARFKKSRDASRALQSTKLAVGVEGIDRYVEDVEGDWLESWDDKEK